MVSRTGARVAALALLVAACGADDDGVEASSPAGSPLRGSTSTSANATTTTAAPALPPDACPAPPDADPGGGGGAPPGEERPLAVEHATQAPVLPDATGATVAWSEGGDGVPPTITVLTLDTGDRRTFSGPGPEAPSLAWLSGGLVAVGADEVRWYPTPAFDTSRVITAITGEYPLLLVDDVADVAWVAEWDEPEYVTTMIDGRTGEVVLSDLRTVEPPTAAIGRELVLHHAASSESFVWDPSSSRCTVLARPAPFCTPFDASADRRLWVCNPVFDSGEHSESGPSPRETELVVTTADGTELLRRTQARRPAAGESSAPFSCDPTMAPDGSAVVCGVVERNIVEGWYHDLETDEVLDLPYDEGAYFGNQFPDAFFLTNGWAVVFVARDVQAVAPGPGSVADRFVVVQDVVHEFGPTVATVIERD